MLIVYRKSDKEIIFNSGRSFLEPSGMSDTNGKLAVIERVGGALDDYGTYRLHDVYDDVKVSAIENAREYSLVFDGSDAPIGVDILKTKEEWLAEQPPKDPSIEERTEALEMAMLDLLLL